MTYQAVPHAGDALPRDTGFGGDQIRAEVLERGTDLKDAHADGVEHETVVHSAAFEMAPDCVNGGKDVLEGSFRTRIGSGSVQGGPVSRGTRRRYALGVPVALRSLGWRPAMHHLGAQARTEETGCWT